MITHSGSDPTERVACEQCGEKHAKKYMRGVYDGEGKLVGWICLKCKKERDEEGSKGCYTGE